MNFQKFFEAKYDTNKIWYHGTTHDFDRFTTDFVGEGVDQEGPGIYFTDNEEDAVSYARKGSSGFLWSVHLNFKKIIPLKGKVDIKDVDQMIEWAPDLSDKLTNWDENPQVALANLKKAILRYKNEPHQCFQQIWYDLYRYQPKDYVSNMTTLGYDGILVPRGFMNTTHAVVLNPKIIERIEKLQV